MVTTPNQVRTIAPEFASRSDAFIGDFITWALPYINTVLWGNKTDHAHALFTAHLMALAARGALVTGSVSSEKVGDLQRSYGNPSVATQLDSTTYGELFWSLSKTLLTSPIVIN